MKRKIFAVLLALSLMFSIIPMEMFVTSAATSNSEVTITVVDSNGNPITDATPTVKVVHTYTSGNRTRTQNVTVTNWGDGIFGYNSSRYNRTSTLYYAVTVTLTADGRTYTANAQVAKNATSVVVPLENFTQQDKYATFDVYYIADGHFPEVFHGAGNEKDYGPAGDDTPLLKINVNITKLKSAEYSDRVLYQENVGNAYHFIPAKISEVDKNEVDENGVSIAYKENIEYASAFWGAVKECMDDESKAAFIATGLFDKYIVYCLKNQGSAASPDNHADGILTVDGTKPITPPVYVIEMYDHTGAIFGGFTNDKDTIYDDPTTMEDVLTAYENHFKQDIDWTVVDGVWRGSYITVENGRKYKYNLEIVQINASDADDFISESGKGIKYEQKTGTYFLAAFQSAAPDPERVDYIVTYTDGVSDNVFNDQVTSLDKGARVDEFKGKTDRENFIFLGWTLEGGDGTVLSQEEIIDTYTSVNEDLTFVAVYMVAPTKYTGTVEVILDGYYNSTTATATGQRIDITDITGDNMSLYVSADGSNYIPLEHKDVGVYSAQLVNGTYTIYYYDGTKYMASSSQHLSINNENRTRYLFFEYVKYELNGGVGGPDKTLRYYYEGTTATASDKVPTKEGYIFAGWKDEDGKIYNSNEVISSAIGKSYVLTAQWVDAADIYVNVTINHNSKNDLGYDDTEFKDEVTLDLVYSPNADTPLLETGDKITISNTNHPKHTYTFEPGDITDEADILKTVYTADGPTVSNVVKEGFYTVYTDKHGYDVTSVNTRPDENGDIFIYVELDYSPQNSDLEFEVRVADNVPSNLVPQAAIVKILSWSAKENKWEMIIEHQNDGGVMKPGVRVNINSETRKGSGYYPVWVSELLDNDEVQPYGYRIVVTSLIYPDGSIVHVNKEVTENLTQNNTDLYTVTMGDVSGGKAYGKLNGAYFEEDIQKGVLDAVITAQGYNVTFDAQGGLVNGFDKQTLTNQYKTPTFEGFVPVRDGGYVFDGWYKDEAYTVPAVENEYLNKDITLYAKWKEPLTVEGLITVGATYKQHNEDGTVTIQKIPDDEWVKTIIVLLQKVEPNGYTDTVDQQFIRLDYTSSGFYHDGRTVGYAYYSFDEIPDYSTNYRIQVLIPNYNATFQNEKDNASIYNWKDYPSYNIYDYTAEFGEIDPDVAVVNVHSHFEPEEFELKYSVNAEQIGTGFIPQKTEILVTADGRNLGVVPSEWPVISQMIFDDKLIGDDVDIINGKGEGSDSVWIGRADGITNYKYGVRVDEVVLADGTRVAFSDSLPFTVEYTAPAYYLDEAQHGELVATLIPKTYKVSYDLNGGTLNGDYPTKHTWSYTTSIEGLAPYFDGFKFDGWYFDEDFTKPAGDVIDASVAENVTLYAKWIQVMDRVNLVVTVKHTEINGGGLASNYDKTLYTQLTYADRNSNPEDRVYIDMPGYAKKYPIGQWHTHGDKVKEDIFEVTRYYTNLSSEYDYSANVMLEGYNVSEKNVEKVDQPDGSTLHIVSVTLQYDPEVFDLSFYVSMAENVPQGAYPQSAEVKVTTWYDDPAADIGWEWSRITQHIKTTITVNIDPETGCGEGSYPVWHWYNEEEGIPYHYRIEVIQLNFADGTAVAMNETLADVSYSGGGYNAEIKVENGSVPAIPNKGQIATKLQGAYGTTENDKQQGTVGAIIDVNKVIFHANNDDALCSQDGDDTFRTYYPAVSASENNELYTLNDDGTVSMFYEIPEFEYNVHNKYIFKGWYLDKDNTDNPVNWDNVYNETTHIYAHWIKTGTIAKEAEDTKQTGSDSYLGFDLIGTQIRDKEVNSNKNHYGTAASGLRFITVLSEDVYAQINAIEGNGAGAEYGYVLARATTAQKNAVGDDYTLQLKGENINGVNTTASHSYVQNFKCSGVDDHYDGQAYRLYTVVITYKNYEGEALEEAYNQNFAARAYIRYYDANGIERVHYNNYTGTGIGSGTGTNFYSGCSTSFAAENVDVLDLVRLKKYLVGTNTTAKSSDYNEDGAVNAIDLVTLTKLVFARDVTSDSDDPSTKFDSEGYYNKVEKP